MCVCLYIFITKFTLREVNNTGIYYRFPWSSLKGIENMKIGLQHPAENDFEGDGNEFVP